MYKNSATLIPCSKSTRRKLNILRSAFEQRNMNNTLLILIENNQKLKEAKIELQKIKSELSETKYLLSEMKGELF